MLLSACSGPLLLRMSFSSRGEQGLLPGCGALASPCSGPCGCGAWALSALASRCRGPCGHGTRALSALASHCRGPCAVEHGRSVPWLRYLQWLLWPWSAGPQCPGFPSRSIRLSSCGAESPWCMADLPPTRHQIWVPCFGRRFLTSGPSGKP